MNEQKPPNGIGWTRIRTRDGSTLRGFTCNPIRGCAHECRWTMPDGKEAICYAENIAEGLAASAYPQGFAHHYWNPLALQQPLALKEPAGIFLGSMSDLMGTQVPREHIEATLAMVQEAHWHTFFLLTKHAPRLRQFKSLLPSNLWIGVSMPPSSMYGRKLAERQQLAFWTTACEVLEELRFDLPNSDRRVFWASLEPLSFDVGALLDGPFGFRFDWLVIGAASNGRELHQPDPQWVLSALHYAARWGIPCYFKENLTWSRRREEFPTWPPDPPQRQLKLF